MTNETWYRAARDRLAAADCPDPEVDARLLQEHVTGLSPRELRRRPDEALSADQLQRLEDCLTRRLSGEPVQYVVCCAWFYGFPFYVDERVLIPRSDTENLVEAAGRFLWEFTEPQALDLCTGSGAIGISLTRICPAVRTTLADISADALNVARENVANLGVGARTELVEGDLFAPLAGRSFHLIACNPPYIPRRELKQLQREVRREPELALDGGADGLDFYRRIAAEVNGHLLPGGRVYLEVGVGQARVVRSWLCKALSAAQSGVIRDLHNIERVVWAEKPYEKDSPTSRSC